MIKLFEKKESEIAKAIKERIERLKDTMYDPDEDQKVIDNIKNLADIEVMIEGPKYSVNPNTIIGAAVTITTTVLILNYEKLNVLSSKAINNVPKIFKF